MTKKFQNSRRRFLKTAMSSTAAMGCYSAFGLQLSAMKAFASQSRFNDHKALVCVFLYGGNDSFNMLVPTDTEQFNAYQQTRQEIAFAQEDLSPLDWSDNTHLPTHAMPSVMSPVIEMFNSGELSVLSNTGPLVEPVTKAELIANPSKIPPQLFSHNSQQALWQTAGTNPQLAQGWLGRMADLMQDTNTSLPMNIGVGNADILSTGAVSNPLVLDSSGPEDFVLFDPANEEHQARLNAHEALLNLADTPLTREYANRIESVRANNELLKAALLNTPNRNNVYPDDNRLAMQLKLVADMIAVQSSLSQQRQVFFVGLGGWDTHDNQAEQHPGLLATLSDALSAFNQDLKNLNKLSDVTTITLSEFGRTLTSNRDGTDHGWAGHQLLMGGAINGKKIHGHLPEQRLNTNDDFDDGRIIPTSSIEQIGVPLASWFGLSPSEITDVFPNAGRFDHSKLQLFK